MPFQATILKPFGHWINILEPLLRSYFGLDSERIVPPRNYVRRYLYYERHKQVALVFNNTLS